MNVKRFVIAALAVFVFVFFYDWLVHGVLLKSLYRATPQIWRTPADMMAKMPLGFVFEFLFSLWFTFVFTQVYKTGGISKGLLLGLFFGVLSGIGMASSYLWLPVSATLGTLWFVTSLVQSLGAGAIAGSIYHKKQVTGKAKK